MFNQQPMYANPYPMRYQQSPIVPQPYTPPAPAPVQPTMMMVTSRAQVESDQVSFDGTPRFYYDTSADVMYVKQFDPRDGTAPVRTYAPQRAEAPPTWATQESVQALARRVEELSALIPQRKARKEAAEE